jgi:hypothetical protein
MRNIGRLLVIVGMVCMASMAFAQEDFWFEHEDETPIFFVTLPENWTGEWQEEEGVSVLHAAPADGADVYLSIWAIHDVADLETAAQAVGEMLAQLVTGANFETWEDVTINEIPFTHSESAATLIDGGADVTVSAALFSPEEEEVYILIFLGTPDAFESHGENLTDVIQSIRLEK